MALDFESIAEATSGAIGALLSTTILYPLDTCKTKYQADIRAQGQARYRHLSDVLWEAISTGQVVSLYQGLGTKNLQSFISQFVYFYGYSYFRKLYLRRSRMKSIGTKANLIVAAAAGACTVIITQPLDVASSRMQTSAFGKSKGLWKTLSEGTWSELFDGLGISLLLTSNPAIQYTVFDQLKQRLLTRQKNIKAGGESSKEALSAFSAFVLGAVSKSIATFLTYPAIRCKVMIQAADPEDDGSKEAQPKSSKTMSDVLYTIWKREGLLGFFKGLQAQILKTVLSSALLLMIKEKITRTTWLLMLALRRNTSGRKTVVFPAISIREKMMSSGYNNLASQKVSGSVPPASDPGHVTVKFAESNQAQGNTSSGFRPLRDADANGSGSDEPQSSGWFRGFTVAAYKPYFDVDTSDVVERIKDSLFPFRGSFSEKTASKPDLYGPFWICTTLIFVAASIGTFVTYLEHELENKEWEYDINMVTWSAGLFYGYVIIVPLGLYVILKYFSAPSGLFQLFCLYGYSLFVFIPASCLSVVPVELFRWVVAGVAGFMSAMFVAINLRVHIMSAGERWFFIVAGIFLLQLALAVVLKIYLFTVTV
ncbi:hypothetical protein NE237_015639 [Protea cynaroides]|uniref:Yip1 domain-containing protein n=1 Tax=Protea cynaroides TaxID=273540 RepID=A0A9Q0QR95_9MAGN|nr:hypothetical protein NE237_015639 [Protea cynaroides]